MTKADAIFFLDDLVKALDNAYISSWQTTHYWQKELDAARDYLKEMEDDRRNSL